MDGINSGGPAVGAVEPHNSNDFPKSQHTGRNGKKQECRWWPDVKPSERADKTGLKNGRLTVFGPVYQIQISNGGWVWLWLGVCECGGEVIYRNVHQTQSCGCLRTERSLEAIRKLQRHNELVRKGEAQNKEKPEAKKGFDRLAICTTPDKLHFECRHYSECQWERLDTKQPSTRYQANPGGCFEKSDEQLGYEAADKWRIKL